MGLKDLMTNPDYIKKLKGLPTTDEEIELLKSKIADLEQGKKSKTKREVASLPKQLLMLHYLGFLDQFDISDVKKGLLFSVLLNGDKNNIRKALPNFIGNQLREIQNIKHLEEIADLFRQVGLNEQSQAVEKDIIRLKTGKL